MKYYVRGQGPVSLTQRDFIARGGQGDIYGRGDTIYKIYLDPAKMIPEAKIRELSVLNRPEIVRPRQVILDPKDAPVGFTMAWVQGATPICRLFTNDFRNRHGITQAHALALMERIKETLAFIHAQGCLVVDGNELNYLVEPARNMNIHFIDVDSYQTPGFPAAAIMPSIRDWLATGLSERTDWYAFAVIACQVFLGIHPYKGKHPDFPKSDIEKRARARISVFNPAVTLPPAARDPATIPAHYRAWLEAVFERGDRSAPPSQPGPIHAAHRRISARPGSGTLIVEIVRTVDGIILRHFATGGKRVIMTDRAVYIDDARYPASPDTDVIFTPRQMTPVFTRIENDRLSLFMADKTPIPMPEMRAAEKLVADNTLYVRHEDHLTELYLADGGPRIVPAVRRVWTIMPHASAVFDGLVFQDILGEPYLMIPEPRAPGGGTCRLIHVPELSGYRVIHARCAGGVCMIVGFKGGRYDRLFIRLGKTGEKHTIDIAADVDASPPNFVALDTGVVVAITEAEGLTLFAGRPGRPDVRRISDPAVNDGMTLSHEGSEVFAFEGATLYRVRMA